MEVIKITIQIGLKNKTETHEFYTAKKNNMYQTIEEATKYLEMLKKISKYWKENK